MKKEEIHAILNVAAFIYLRFVCRSLVSVLLTLYIFVNRRFRRDRMELFAGAVVLSKLHAANVAPISSRSADSDRASVWSSSLSSLFYSWMSCQSVCFKVLQLHLLAWNDQLVYSVSNCLVALASNFRKWWISSFKLAPRLMFTSVYPNIFCRSWCYCFRNQPPAYHFNQKLQYFANISKGHLLR